VGVEMSQDVQWQEIEVPILGINESVDPVVLPAGQLVDVLNGEYSTYTGSIRKRTGLDLVINPSGTIPGADRIATFRNQLLTIDTEGSLVRQPAIYVPREAAGLYRNSNIPISNVTVERNSITGELGASTRGDMAIVNGFAVYALINRRQEKITVKIKELSSGSIVYDDSFPYGSEPPEVIRAAASGSYVLIAWTQAISGNIVGAKVNCAGTSPAVGSPTVIEGNKKTFSYDMMVIGSTTVVPRWYIAFKTTTDDGWVTAVNSQLTHDWIQRFGNDVFAMSITEHGENVWVNWFDIGLGEPGWMYTAFDIHSAVPATGTVNWGGAADPLHDFSVTFCEPGGAIMSSIVGVANNDNAVLVCHSQPYSTTTSGSLIELRPILRWRTGDLFGTLTSLRSKRGGQLLTNVWRSETNGFYNVWVSTSGRTADNQIVGARERTMCLLSLSADTNRAQLEATAAGNITAEVFWSSTSTFNTIAPRSVTSDGTGAIHSLIDMRIVPGESVSAPQEIIVRTDHRGRFSSAEYGGHLYFAGGLLTQWDGSRYSENMFVSSPILETVASPAPGDWSQSLWQPGDEVNYVAIYETISATGERSKSQVSDVKTFKLNSLIDTVELTLEPATITRRYWGENYDESYPQVVVAVYRSMAGNSNILQRIFTYDSLGTDLFVSDPESLGPIVLHDRGTGSDDVTRIYDPGSGITSEFFSSSAHEVIYTASGEPENETPYGGCTSLAVHQDRLFVAGGEDPELIMYSKPRADGRPAEFSLTQQIRIPGHKVVALGSMDDTLYVFCKRGIFAIFGNGPNATGDANSGTFSEPAIITTAMGCTEPRSVVQTPIGIMFRSESGIHIVDKGSRSVSWVGQPVSATINEYPIVRAAKIIPEKTQVRFAVSKLAEDDDGNVNETGLVLVYDWEETRWTKWKYANMEYTADLGVWEDHPNVVLAPSGELFTENNSKFLDNTSSYTMSIETGWFSFGRLQGYKKIRKIGLLMEKLGSHGLSVRFWYKYTKDGLSAIKSFTPLEISAIPNPEWIRITMPYQKQPSVMMYISEQFDDENPGSAGFSVKGFSFEIGMLPGLTRLPQGQSR
jgi:hypothetical protein